MQPSSSWPAQPAGGPARLLLCRLRPRQREGSVPGARARHRATPPARLPACLSPPRLDALERRHAPPVLSHSPPVLPLLSLALSLPCPNAPIAAVRHSRRHRPPLASPTRSPAPPRPPLPPRRATQDGAPRGAIAVAILASGRRGYSPSIRELPGIPDLVLALAGLAVSPSPFPLSSPPRSLTVALLPTTTEASRRRPCRRRRLGPPPPKPSIPSRSQCREGAAEPLRWPPCAPQPDPARARTPSAAQVVAAVDLSHFR